MRNSKRFKSTGSQNSIPATSPSNREVHPAINPMETASAPQMPTQLVINSYDSPCKKKDKSS